MYRVARKLLTLSFKIYKYLCFLYLKFVHHRNTGYLFAMCTALLRRVALHMSVCRERYFDAGWNTCAHSTGDNQDQEMELGSWREFNRSRNHSHRMSSPILLRVSPEGLAVFR